jgi:regulator of replication initiation timing
MKSRIADQEKLLQSNEKQINELNDNVQRLAPLATENDTLNKENKELKSKIEQMTVNHLEEVQKVIDRQQFDKEKALRRYT